MHEGKRAGTGARIHAHLHIHKRQQEYARADSQSPTLIFSQTAHTHSRLYTHAHTYSPLYSGGRLIEG